VRCITSRMALNLHKQGNTTQLPLKENASKMAGIMTACRNCLEMEVHRFCFLPEFATRPPPCSEILVSYAYR
jgi:recombinational DNA repair protein RecR